jgi:hypothetical protein
MTQIQHLPIINNLPAMTSPIPFQVPMDEDQQRECVWAYRSALIRIGKLEKSLSDLTMLLQEMIDKKWKLTVAK